MKVLIWFLCLQAFGFIYCLFLRNGVILGFIPTVALFAGTVWLALSQCKKWDEHKEAVYRDRMHRLLEEIKNEKENGGK